MTANYTLFRNLPASIAILPLLFYLVLPAFLAKENIRDFTHFNPKVFIVLACLAIFTFLILWIFHALLKKFHINIYFSEALRFLCFFILIAGFAFPLSVSEGMIDPKDAEINVTNVLISLSIASLMMWISLSRFRDSLFLGVVIYVFLNASVSAYIIYVSIPNESAAKSLFELSRQKNIFVLSFDGIPGSVVEEVLNDNADIKKRFSGFLFYDKVATSSPATAASIAASLYGNQNFKKKYETENQLWESNPELLLTNILHNNGYDVSTFGAYNQNFEDKSRQHNASPRGSLKAVSLLNYSIARAFTRIYVIRGKLRKSLEKFTEGIISPTDDAGSELIRNINASQAPAWKHALSSTILDYNDYLENLKIANEKPVAHFLHFTFTHHPVEFDRDCQFRGHHAEWFDSMQNHIGVKEEVACALAQFSQFIEKLKEFDLFDRSLIVLKSDHGKPVYYYNDRDIGSIKINGHVKYGIGRYAPFLAIKDFHDGSSGIKHDSSPVMLDDLARTLCEAAEIDFDCNQYPGFNLLKDNLTITESDKVTLFVVKSAQSDYRYDTHEAITVPRNTGVVESLHRALNLQYLTSNISCKSPVNVASSSPLNNGLSDYQSWLTWEDQGSVFLRLMLGSHCHYHHFGIEFEGTNLIQDDYMLLVNDKVIDVPFAGKTTTGGSSRVMITIPKDLIPDSRELQFELRPANKREYTPTNILKFGLDVFSD